MSISRLRILAGIYGGRKLAVGPGVRPTESRVREALFGIWQQSVIGCRFLDLFAGSGAVGLEALSRGAVFSLLVEGSSTALEAANRNRRALGDSRAELRRGRLPGWLSRNAPSTDHRRFDLIFADPPYRFADYEQLISASAAWLAEPGRVAVEHSARRDLPEACAPFELYDRRSYGEAALSFYRKQP